MKRIMMFLLLFSACLCFAAEKLIFYSTTDIHGKVFSAKDKPNLLKLVKAIRDDSAKSGRDRTLLIDCGDLIQGSFETQTDKGGIVVALMNLAGFDAWIPGNHDFELGFDTLIQRGRDFKGDQLCANISLGGKRPMPAWKIYRRGGLDVAVIGITSEHIASWNWKPDEKGLAVQKTLPALSAVMPEIMKRKPDLIVLAIHAGRFQSTRFKPQWDMRSLAEKYPQIDLILGGHTHEPVKGLPLAGKVWYTQAGVHAGGYSKIEVTYDKQKRKRLSLTSSYHALPPDAEPVKITDPELKKKLGALRKGMFTPICRNAPALGAREAEKTALFFCDAIQDQTKAKIVFHGVLSHAEKHAGKYSRKDVYDLCPFENTVILTELAPSEVRAILKEQAASRKSRRKYGMPQFVKGVRMDSNGNLFFADGTPWTREDQRETVAFNSFIASSAGMRFPVLKQITWKKSSNGRDTGLKVRDMLEIYLRRNFQ